MTKEETFSLAKLVDSLIEYKYPHSPVYTIKELNGEPATLISLSVDDSGGILKMETLTTKTVIDIFTYYLRHKL